jgi:hypothetical protein
VLGKLQVKATASVERAVEEDLKKEDPSAEEARAILDKNPLTIANKTVLKPKDPESANESTKGNDTKRSPRSDKQDLR